MLSIIQRFLGSAFALLLAACAASPSADTPTVTFQIAPYKLPCTGAGLQLCYWVSRNGAKAEYFYDEIAGFDYEWGYTYELLVEEVPVNHPPSDASSINYRLRELVRRDPVPADSIFELPLLYHDQPIVDTVAPTCTYYGDIQIHTGAYTCADLAGAPAADFRYDTRDKQLVLVAIK